MNSNTRKRCANTRHFTGIDPAVGHEVGVVVAGWLRFETGTPVRGRRTLVWRVSTKEHRLPLGEIDWYSPWRRYVFEPEAGTLYEEDCLRVIAAFVENLTRRQRATWKGGAST